MVEAEEIAMGPDVGAIVAKIKRHVSNQADSRFPAIGSPRIPLAKENELEKFFVRNFPGGNPP
jgi:hypothetical protein